MRPHYFNEFDPHAAAWLRELIREGLLPNGEVDERDIKEVTASDLRGFDSCHFFSGIGGWPLSLQIAGWPADRPVWTGSCPCQPYSSAGKGEGDNDPRNLWPDFFRLIRECRPECVFGEQVEGAIRHGWLDRVCSDMEGEGYAVGSCVLGAHSAGAPHIRQRLYWVAHRASQRRKSKRGPNFAGERRADESERLRTVGGVADSHGERFAGRAEPHGRSEQPEQQAPRRNHALRRGADGIVGHTTGVGRQGDERRSGPGEEPVAANAGAGSGAGVAQGDAGPNGPQGEFKAGAATAPTVGADGGFWSDSTFIPCKDGKRRRVPTEPALFPLAHGLPARVGLLRGAGNAIVPQVAAEFVKAFLEVEAEGVEVPKTATRPTPPKPAPAPAVRAPALPEPPVSVGVPATAGPETWASVRLDLIRRCAFNVRQRFALDDVAGLGESIRADRLKEPLLVRPVGAAAAPTYDGRTWSGLDHYEVADGERRLRALLWICETYPDEAGAAALVPVIVRPMTDDRVRAVMLVSREQSRDLAVSELVAGYTELRKSQPDDAAVAALVGKSVAHVRGVLRLAKLPAWALAAVDAGTLPRATAELVARVPGEGAREKAAACVLHAYTDPSYLNLRWSTQLEWRDRAAGIGFGHVGCDGVLSYRDTKDLIRNHFTVELKGAPFSRKELYVWPDCEPGHERSMTDCETCPSRAGNNEEAVADKVRGDVCLDPDCYRAKVKAYRAKEVAKAEKRGLSPVPEDFPEMGVHPPKGWCELSTHFGRTEVGLGVVLPQSKSGKTLEELLADCDPTARYLAFDQWNKKRTLVRTADARRVLVGAGVLKKPEPRKKESKAENAPSTDTGSKSAGAATKKPAEFGPTFTEIDEKAAEIASGVLREFAEDQCKGLTDLGENDPVHTLLGLAVRAVCYDLAMKRDEACGPILRRLGAVDGEDKGLAIDRAVSAMSAPQQMGLLVELAAAIELRFGSATRDTAAGLLAFAEVDWEAVKEQARRVLTGGESVEVGFGDPPEAPAEQSVLLMVGEQAERLAAFFGNTPLPSPREAEILLAQIPGFPSSVELDWTLAKLLDRTLMVAQFDLDNRTPEKAMAVAFEPFAGPEVEWETDEEKAKIFAERDRIATSCRDAVMSYLKGLAPRSATRLASIDNFPDAVADRLAPGVTTLPTLLEAVEAETAGIDLPLRNKLVTFFVKLGVKLKPAEHAADAVAEHVGEPEEKATNAERDLPKSIDENLRRALHRIQGCDERWEARVATGLSDAGLKEAIGYEFGGGGGQLGGGYDYRVKGGTAPAFWFPDVHRTTEDRKPTLSGMALLNKVREVMGVPLASHTGDKITPVNGKAAKSKGEPIEPLGVTPAQLRGAICWAEVKGLKGMTPPEKPPRVGHVTLNGRPHIVESEGEHFPGPGSTFTVRPLWSDVQAERRGVAPTHADPLEGLTVEIRYGNGKAAGWTRFVIGSKAESRALVHKPVAKERPKKAAAK